MSDRFSNGDPCKMMTKPVEEAQNQLWELPPLILHPFNQDADHSKLLESIKLSLYSHGLLELGEAEGVESTLLQGRYSEFRMLCCIGKDLLRWMRQCTDFAGRNEQLSGAGIREQSFSELLVVHTPQRAQTRFEGWGVADYRRIFRRAIGLNAVFPHPPDYSVLSMEFLVNCYAYADALYLTYQNVVPFAKLDPHRFLFSVFTSTEYANRIENDSEQA